MPAMLWCRRRWLDATDDYVCRAGVLTLTYFSLSVALYILIAHGDFGQESEASLAGCPLTNGDTLSNVLLAQLVMDIISMITFGALFLASVRGRILEPSKRAAVPIVLYFVGMGLLANIVLSVLSIHYGMTLEGLDACRAGHVRRTLAFVVVANAVAWGYVAVTLLFAFDPAGGRDNATLRGDGGHTYTSLWHTRCDCATSCCCLVDSNDPGHSEVLPDVAATMARLFDAHDIVLSDISAGLVLLHRFQQAVHRDVVERIRRSRVDAAAESMMKRHGLSLSETACVLPAVSAGHRAELREVQHYSKFYFAAYGSLLYWYRNLMCGPFRLWASDFTMCCRKHPRLHQRAGDCCYCNVTAIRTVAGVGDEDVLYTSFENRVLLPAFFVALDHATNAVVIAIRGSMSLSDCITDVVAQPRPIVLSELQGEFASTTRSDTQEHGDTTVHYAHGGIIKCADNVLSRLTEAGVLAEIIDGRFKERRVVIVGHSLGAGVATLLAIKLREAYPTALQDRLKGYAYAPPGGLLSRALSEHTSSFVTAVFLGKDLVPRLSAHTMDGLRDSMFLALAATKHTKARIVANAVCPRWCCPLGRLPDALEASDEELRGLVELLRSTSDSDFNPTGVNYGSTAGVFAVAPGQQQQQQSNVTTVVTVPAEGRTSTSSGPPTPAAASSSALFRPAAGSTDPMLSAPRDLKLYPPARLIHLVRQAERSKLCSCLCSEPGVAGCFREHVCAPVWITPDHIQEVVVSPMMVADHFPDHLFFALQSTVDDLETITNESLPFLFDVDQPASPLASGTERTEGRERPSRGHGSNERVLYAPRVPLNVDERTAAKIRIYHTV